MLRVSAPNSAYLCPRFRAKSWGMAIPLTFNRSSEKTSAITIQLASSGMNRIGLAKLPATIMPTTSISPFGCVSRTGQPEHIGIIEQSVE